MQRLYNVSIIASIIILIVLLIKQINTKQDLIMLEELPQEHMKGIKLFSYDQKGILKNIIISNYWKFLAKNNISILKNPKITIYKWPNFSYKIEGDFGKILHNNNLNTDIKLIKLYSNIHINQKYLDDNKHGFNLSTSYLEWNPNNDIATTEKPVSIYKPGLIINGIGMRADLKNHQLELNKDVSSKYIDNHHIDHKHNNTKEPDTKNLNPRTNYEQ